jgi:glutamine amidotransferase
MTLIAILDYDIGNVRSISSAFENAGAEVVLSRDPKIIAKADGLILPGVGAFSHAMEKLHLYGLVSVIEDHTALGKPLLGICLGMQILLSSSEEFGSSKGLGLIAGKIVKLSPKDPDYQKLPHVSWNEIYSTKSWHGTVLEDIDQHEDMYFVHSFTAQPDDSNHILSHALYSGEEFCATVRQDNIYGCQFHPEKSGKMGLKIIDNFLNICKINSSGSSP